MTEGQGQGQRPPAPGIGQTGGSTYRPEELNADLAAAKIARDMIGQLGRPSIITKKFALWNSIATSLQQSGLYDCSLRCEVYKAAEDSSVNVSGHYFNNFWAYLNRPKQVLMGMPYVQQEEEEKPGLLSRVAGWFRGGDQNGGNAQAGSR